MDASQLVQVLQSAVFPKHPNDIKVAEQMLQQLALGPNYCLTLMMIADSKESPLPIR